MKKKGFTLIEILAVIVIIGVLSGIGIISARTFLKTGEEKYYNALESSALLAANDYYADHRDELPTGNAVKEVPLSDLVDGKYLEQLKDSNGNICNNGVVYVYHDDNKYTYEVCLRCGNYESNGVHCQETLNKKIQMSARKKGTDATYTLTTANLAEYSTVNVMVTFSMKNNKGVSYKAVNTKNGTVYECSVKEGETSCEIDVSVSGTYLVTAYDKKGKVAATNEYFNVKFAHQGPQFTISGSTNFDMDDDESVCNANGNKKAVSFKIEKANINDEFKSLKYRIIKAGENSDNVSYITWGSEQWHDFTINDLLESGSYTLEVVATDFADVSHSETHNFYVSYLIDLEYEDDHTTGTYRVVKGQNYGFIPNMSLPATKTSRGVENVPVMWHPANEEYSDERRITDATTVTNGCTYKIMGFAPLTISIPDDLAAVYCANPTYNGSQQSLTKVVEGLTFLNTSGNAPLETNAGTYQLKARVNTPQYIWRDLTTADKPLSCSIEKADPACPTISNYEGTYDGSAHTITTSGGTGHVKFQYRSSSADEWSDNQVTRTDAGETTVYVKVVGDDNHLDKECGSAKVIISKADNNVTVTSNTYSYDGSIHEATLNATVGTPTATYYSDSTCTTQTTTTNANSAGGAPKNAGTYYAIGEVAESTNYKKGTSTCTKAVVINRVDVVCPTVSNNNLTYDGSAHTVTTTGGSGYSKLQYLIVKTNTWTDTPITITNVGSENVTIRAVGDVNHNTKECGSATVTITKANNQVTITSKTYTYAADTGRSTTVTTLDGNPAVVYYSDSSCSTKTTTTNATAAGGPPINAGTYYATAKVNATDNYKAAAATCTKAVVINRANVTFPTCADTPYTGKSQTLFAAHTDTSGKYTNSKISGTDRGNYTGNLKPTANYKWKDTGETGARQLTCTIVKGDVEVWCPYCNARPDAKVVAICKCKGCTFTNHIYANDPDNIVYTAQSQGYTCNYKNANSNYNTVSSSKTCRAYDPYDSRGYDPGESDDC